MTLQQWFDKVGGKKIDMDGYPPEGPYQCVDLVKSYFVDVVGIPAIRNNAVDYWTNYPTAHFTRITNTPSFVPIRGDIMIWGSTANPGWDGKNVGKYGHVAIVISGNVNTFSSLDQNWSPTTGLTASKVTPHNYSAVKGVLRPKKDVNFDQAAYDAAVAAENAQKAAIEAAKIAEADRVAKEKAAAEKAEQIRVAAEQAKLEADLRAKQEAEAEKAKLSLSNLFKKLIELIKALFNKI